MWNTFEETEIEIVEDNRINKNDNIKNAFGDSTMNGFLNMLIVEKTHKCREYTRHFTINSV